MREVVILVEHNNERTGALNRWLQMCQIVLVGRSIRVLCINKAQACKNYLLSVNVNEQVT